MTAEVEFCLLGPLLVRRAELVITISSAKQRVVLAALLVAGNAVVAQAQLIEALWGPHPPSTARAALQNHLSRLRRQLAELGVDRVRTSPHGYSIIVGEGELDSARFELLTEQARASARCGDWESASALLHEALSLWRGEPLADVPSELLAMREGQRLSEMRMNAIEARLDADLHLGRHADVIGELRQLIAAHPLREHPRAMLMLALYRNGQQADALAVYQQARTTLIAELGTEPGPELRQLELRILSADPELVEPPAPATGTAPAAAVLAAAAPAAAERTMPSSKAPRQLPAPVWHFAGRRRELAVLTAMLGDSGQTIATIDGPAGIGKTSLAVYWAHQVADTFPDGQLYVDLRGFDPSGTPVGPEEAIRGFLEVLAPSSGPGSGPVPANLDAQSALYRSLLTGQRMLIVLDNARDETQIRPLLPGSPGCLVVVTSRRQLGGLIAESGARPVSLDLLSESEALDLLASRLGAGRVAAEQEAAAELTGLCARLPLALAVAAARASMRASFPLTSLVAELRDTADRLAGLEVGDATTSVSAAFSWSCGQLSPIAARLLLLLGLHPGPDFTAAAAAALAAIEFTAARDALRELAHISLCAEHAPGRYTFHDLLRAFAHEQAAAQLPEEARNAALTRLLDHYLATAAVAVDVLMPAEQHLTPEVPQPASPIPSLPDPASASSWLDAERANLIAMVALAASGGWPRHATRFALVLFRYLDRRGDHGDAVAVHSHALQAARSIGDLGAQADSRRCLGCVAWWQGDYSRAAEHLAAALELHQRTGDRIGEARSLDSLGLVVARQGRYADAYRYHQQSQAIFSGLGDRLLTACAMENQSVVLARLGHYQEAGDRHRQTLAMFRQMKEPISEAGALDNLGVILLKTGHHEQAREHHEQALAAFRELGHPEGEAGALGNLGTLLASQGNHQQATLCHLASLNLFRELGDQSGEAAQLNQLGSSLASVSQLAAAFAAHREALALSERIGDRYELARANAALGKLQHDSGETRLARQHRKQALAIFTELGVPEADEVATALQESRHRADALSGADSPAGQARRSSPG